MVDWQEIKKEIISVYNTLSKNRYKKVGKYIFDRLIFNIMMFAIFGFLFFVAAYNNFELDYYVCPDGNAGALHGSRVMLENFEPSRDQDGKCKNPFYKESWKNQEYLLPGEYGTRPGKLFDSMEWVVILLFFSAFMINHYIHNRKYNLRKVLELK